MTWGLMYKACLSTKKLRKQLLTQMSGCTKTDLKWISTQTSCLAYAHFGCLFAEVCFVSWQHIETVQRNSIMPTRSQVMN